MSEIIALGYVGVTAPDVDKFAEFATGVMGMTISPGSSDEQLRVRMDERTWRLWVEPGDGGLGFTGWEVASAVELDRLASRLDGLGIAVKEDTRLAKQRQVNGLVLCSDPDGNQLELFHGAKIDHQPFFSPLGRRFVTRYDAPGDLGLGHIALMFDDSAAAQEFYMDILGFRLSDTIFGAPFVHVNRRHHSLVIGPSGPGRPSGLNHIMFEVEDLDMVGYALDTVERRTGEKITLTLGKHTNDRMTSFYVRAPGGFDIEYGCGGVYIDDATWTTANYESFSFWGHISGSQDVA